MRGKGRRRPPRRSVPGPGLRELGRGGRGSVAARPGGGERGRHGAEGRGGGPRFLRCARPGSGPAPPAPLGLLGPMSPRRASAWGRSAGRAAPCCQKRRREF